MRQTTTPINFTRICKLQAVVTYMILAVVYSSINSMLLEKGAVILCFLFVFI